MITHPDARNPPMCQYIHSVNKCLLSTYYVPDPVLHTGDTAENKANQIEGYPSHLLPLTVPLGSGGLAVNTTTVGERVRVIGAAKVRCSDKHT